MTKKGVNIILNDSIEAVDKQADGLHISTTDGKSMVVDQAMLALGRVPAIESLGLEKAGVELNKGGAIAVDSYSKTNVDSIYAVGDVTDRVNLTPVAIREGHAFADTIYGGKDITVDHSGIATAVFSQPEIGTIGLSQEEAEAEYGDIDIYSSSFRPMKNILPGRNEKMLMKLIVDVASDKVVGCHIVGPDSGEMSQLVGVAMKMGATKADFDNTMAVHPTASEELVTMRSPTKQIRK